jgi:hypothetical protein
VSGAAFADVGSPSFESIDMHRIGDVLTHIPLATAGAGRGGPIYAEFAAFVLNDSHTPAIVLCRINARHRKASRRRDPGCPLYVDSGGHLKRLKCANSDHSATALRTGQIDPLGNGSPLASCPARALGVDVDRDRHILPSTLRLRHATHRRERQLSPAAVDVRILRRGEVQILRPRQSFQIIPVRD